MMNLSSLNLEIIKMKTVVNGKSLIPKNKLLKCRAPHIGPPDKGGIYVLMSRMKTYKTNLAAMAFLLRFLSFF